MHCIFFIHPSLDWHWGCFHVLVAVNSAAVNTGVYVSFGIVVFSRCVPQSGISGSYVNSIFSFLRNCHTVLHRGYTNYQLTSHQECRRISFSALPLQQLLFVDFLMVVILTSVRCYPIAILVCSSLIISDIKYLFTCLVAIHMSSLEKCLFRCPAHFLIGLFVVLILSCMSCW